MFNLDFDSIINNCRLVIISGKDLTRPEGPLIYECWKNSWQTAFKEEMNVQEKLYSDDFTRQDEIIALFFKSDCVGLAFTKYIDLNNQIHIDDSYFKSWPDESIENLKKLSSNISSASYFTVNAKYRGRNQIIRWKQLLIEVFVRNFAHSPAKLMIAAARRNKSNEKTTFMSGAFALAENLPYQIPGETIDLVCWQKPLKSSADPHLNQCADQLWEKYYQEKKSTHNKGSIDEKRMPRAV